MIVLLHVLASAGLLGAASWASNLWPGVETWTRAAVSRVLWWGMPFFGIGLLNGAPTDHAVWLGAAAWCGAWIPHTAMPDVRMQASAMVVDLAIVIVRVMGLLAAPTAVFWMCGAWWWGMVMATGSIVPCILIANSVSAPVRGLASPRHMAGVLFGVATGGWTALAIMLPVPFADWLT